ncbi:DUF2634 domain-containing protein [Peptacetobacter hiranonis]|uniref:Phage protein XkdS n=1 Tax=Peptacetobacter hiranonis (strain DSM 13275 / JCM 10541 / KCTC 15199 / TO-931) TaxID=500633 RepID=B6G010_PEPHT|nr:DUF2634 domain-containing protein [Peptacetobacter hiranonis]EEA84838.1 phage protein XkdS [Peptacetobacter hiranonis DSM 13275]QEK20756.1 hypothetical protein KGNDJEFE_01243 [Peptacetobacter hiranonis]
MADNNFFPFIGTESDYIPETNNELPLYREFAWDFAKDDFIKDNSGDFKIVEGKEALQVWIYHALHTNRYEHEIFSWDYGTELITLVGQRFTKGLTESEAFRYIKEALLVNEYLLSVKKNSIVFDGDVLHIDITVKTVYGEVRLVV